MLEVDRDSIVYGRIDDHGHHLTKNHMQKAADAGCQICNVLWTRWTRKAIFERMEILADLRHEGFFSNYSLYSDMVSDTHAQGQHELVGLYKLVGLYIKISERISVGFEFHDLENSTERDCGCHMMNATRSSGLASSEATDRQIR